MNAPAWLWIPIVFAAAASQTVRNAAQKNLTKTAGTLAATSVRFIYGLPFALLLLAATLFFSGRPAPTPNASFAAWVLFGAVAQLIATALLLAAMQQRSFIVALAYSKTEVLQVALYASLLRDEHVSPAGAFAVLLATAGVLMLSIVPGAVRPASGAGRFAPAWFSPTAWLGIGSGAGFALSAVGYRAASQSLGDQPAWVAGAYGLVWAQVIQSVLIGAYLALREPHSLRVITREWRTSLLAGFAGAFASFGWFTAFALRSAADVRTLALVEVLYGYAVSRRVFREPVSGREKLGIALLVLGIVVVSMQL